MLRQFGWGEEAGPPLPRRRYALGRVRWRLLATIALAIVIVGFLTGLTSSRRGWLEIALAVLLVAALGAHHAAGGGRRLVRALAEYTAVVVLVALLAAGVAGHHPTVPRHVARPRPPAGAARAGHACGDPSIAHAPSWVACVWHRAMDPAPTPPPTTTGRHR